MRIEALHSCALILSYRGSLEKVSLHLVSSQVNLQIRRGRYTVRIETMLPQLRLETVVWSEVRYPVIKKYQLSSLHIDPVFVVG